MVSRACERAWPPRETFEPSRSVSYALDRRRSTVRAVGYGALAAFALAFASWADHLSRRGSIAVIICVAGGVFFGGRELVRLLRHRLVQRVVITGDALIVPASPSRSEEIEIPWGDVRSWEDRRPERGERALRVEHDGGTAKLRLEMFAAERDYFAVVDALRGACPSMEVR